MRKRFRSGVNSARTRSFPRADIASDHDLLMMTFHLRLKRTSKPKHTRLKFDFEKLKYPNVLETFQAIITIMNNEDTDMDSMITTFNTAVSETAPEIIGKHRQKTKTGSLQKFLIKGRELRKKRIEPERYEKYKEVNNNIKRCMKKAKENLTGEQCSEIYESLSKSNSKEAYHLVNDLTTVKQGKGTTVQNSSAKCLTEKNDRY